MIRKEGIIHFFALLVTESKVAHLFSNFIWTG